LDRDQKGLGAYLYESLSQKIPVIGISKSLFNSHTDFIQSVYRPSSAKPLYISAIGIALKEACKKVETMYGLYRLPEMIKRADTLCRSNMLPD